MKFAFRLCHRPKKCVALWLAGALLGVPGLGLNSAQAQPAPRQTDDVYRPLLPPAIAQSPALLAFSASPFANADVRPGETSLLGFFVISVAPGSITLKIVSSVAPDGKVSEFDPPQGKQIRLNEATAVWAAAKKRENIDWENVIDYAPVYVVGVDGGAGEPFVARKVDVLDGYIGDILKDPEVQARIQEMQAQVADMERMSAGELPQHAMWLEDAGIAQMKAGYGKPNIAKSIDNNALRLGGTKYPHGIGTHADSELQIDLKGKATRFAAMVGVDDEMKSNGSVVFSVWVDGEKVAGSTIMRVGDEPEFVEADLTGAKTLRLQVTDAGDGPNSDHADWAGALLELTPTTDVKNPSSTPSAISSADLQSAPAPDENQLRANDSPPDALWLETLNLDKMSSGYNRPQRGKSIDNNPIRLNNQVYPHGVGTHAESRFQIDLKRNATRFSAMVGVDNEISTNGSVVFSVWVDGQEMANTGVIRAGEPARMLSVNLVGATMLELRAGDAEDGVNSDHADWAGALIQLVPGTYENEAPVAVNLSDEED